MQLIALNCCYTGGECIKYKTCAKLHALHSLYVSRGCTRLTKTRVLVKITGGSRICGKGVQICKGGGRFADLTSFFLNTL